MKKLTALIVIFITMSVHCAQAETKQRLCLPDDPNNCFETNCQATDRVSCIREVAQQRCTKNNAGDCIQFWINFLPTDPKLALHYLSQYDHPTADIFRALLYGYFPAFKNQPKFELSVSRAMRHMPGEQGFIQHDISTEVDFMSTLRELLTYQGSGHASHIEYFSVPCWLLKRFPQTAFTAFGMYYGSSLDMLPSVNCVAREMPRPITALAVASAPVMGVTPRGNGCTGTSIYGKYRRGYMDDLRVRLAPDTITVSEVENISQSLASLRIWSTRNIHNHHAYHVLLAAKERSTVKLSNFYRQHGYGRKQSQQLAQRVIDYYLSNHFDYSSSIYYVPPYNEDYIAFSDLLRNKTYQSYIAGKKHPACLLSRTCKTNANQIALYVAISDGLLNGKSFKRLNPWLQQLKQGHGHLLALAVNRPKLIARLLNWPGLDVNTQDGIGKTALFFAIQAKNFQSVKSLVQSGADVNIKTYPEAKMRYACTNLDAFKRTPLMYASWQGNHAIIQYLMAHDADEHAKDSNEQTAADYLPKNKQLSSPQQTFWRVQLQEEKRAS